VFTRQLSAMTIMLVLPIAVTLLRDVFTLQLFATIMMLVLRIVVFLQQDASILR